MDLPYFALEVKRCTELNLTQWWAQTLNQAEDHDRWPLLLYRVDRQRSWTVVVSLGYILNYSSAGDDVYAGNYSFVASSPVAMTPEAFNAHLSYVGLYSDIRDQLLSEEQSNDKSPDPISQGQAG